MTDMFVHTKSSHSNHCLLLVVAAQVDRLLVARVVLLESLHTAISQQSKGQQTDRKLRKLDDFAYYICLVLIEQIPKQIVDRCDKLGHNKIAPDRLNVQLVPPSDKEQQPSNIGVETESKRMQDEDKA